MSFNPADIKVFAICIIESLSDSDAKTGSELINDLLKYKKFQEPNITLRLSQLQTKKEIFEEIALLYEKVKNEGWSIILHFEAHGCQEGIGTASGEIIGWRELMNCIRPINVFLENFLIVQLGMCQGAWIISAIDPTDRAPFKAAVATMKNIGERDLLHAFTRFYDHFLFELDIWAAAEAMNSGFSAEKPVFEVMRIDTLFDAIANPDRDPKHFKKMLDDAVAKALILYPEARKRSYNSLREEHEQFIRGEFKNLRAKRDYFLMKKPR